MYSLCDHRGERYLRVNDGDLTDQLRLFEPSPITKLNTKIPQSLQATDCS